MHAVRAFQGWRDAALLWSALRSHVSVYLVRRCALTVSLAPQGALAAQRPGFSGRPAAVPFHGAPRVARPESRRRAAAEEAEAAVDAAPGPSGKNQLYFGKDTESLTDVFAFAGPAPEVGCAACCTEECGVASCCEMCKYKQRFCRGFRAFV